MLLILHRTEAIKALFDQIKVKALDRGIDKSRLQELWPEFFPVDPFEEALQEDGTFDPDLVNEDAIVFTVPKDASEDEEISAWIREREEGTISGAVLNQWV